MNVAFDLICVEKDTLNRHRTHIYCTGYPCKLEIGDVISNYGLRYQVESVETDLSSMEVKAVARQIVEGAPLDETKTTTAKDQGRRSRKGSRPKMS